MTPEQKKSFYLQGKKLGAKAAALITPAWSDADFAALSSACKTAKMDPLDLMAVMTNEANLEPSARNPSTPSKWPIAVGLNQINQDAATGMGLIAKGDDAAWKKLASEMVAMTPSQQIPIVMRYFASTDRGKAGLPWPSAVQIYMANAGSGYSMMQAKDDAIVYQAGSPEYEGNKGLDRGGKGNVTVRDLRLVLDDMTTTPVFTAAALRYALPSLRAGFVAGWTAGQARSAADLATTPSSVDADYYRLGYIDGYEAAARLPVGSTTTFPSYLQ